MSKLRERLIELRKNTGLSQKKFAAKLNMSQTGYASLETGANNITDRTIADICREFNVNEEWLRTGDGEMLKSKKSIDVELSELVASIVKTDDNFVKNALILSATLLVNMPEDQRKKFEETIKEMAACLIERDKEEEEKEK